MMFFLKISMANNLKYKQVGQKSCHFCSAFAYSKLVLIVKPSIVSGIVMQTKKGENKCKNIIEAKGLG